MEAKYRNYWVQQIEKARRNKPWITIKIHPKAESVLEKMANIDWFQRYYDFDPEEPVIEISDTSGRTIYGHEYSKIGHVLDN